MNAGGRLYRLVAEHTGLDFLNASTAAGRHGSGRIFDYDSLLRFLEEKELVACEAIELIRANTGSNELNAISAEAKALSAWFRDFVDDFKGKPQPPSAVDRLRPLNGILARDTQIGQIVVGDDLNDRIAGSGLRWSTRRIWRSADILLLPITHAMAELICTVDFSNIRVCEGPGCGTFFLDGTRERTRSAAARELVAIRNCPRRCNPPGGSTEYRRQEPRCASRIDPRWQSKLSCRFEQRVRREPHISPQI